LLGSICIHLVDDGFKSLSKLVSDPVTLADVLYCLCKDQADKQSITDEDFGRALAGDAITLAADAFVEELIDFFPDARARSSLRKAIEAGKTVRDKVLSHAEKILDSIDPETEATEVDQLVWHLAGVLGVRSRTLQSPRADRDGRSAKPGAVVTYILSAGNARQYSS
jgi:hypothetical protein